MVASTLAVELVQEAALELAFEVVLLAVARFRPVGPALPKIRAPDRRRFSVGLAGRVECIPVAGDRERGAVAAGVAIVSSILRKFAQSGAKCRRWPR